MSALGQTGFMQNNVRKQMFGNHTIKYDMTNNIGVSTTNKKEFLSKNNNIFLVEFLLLLEAVLV